LIICVRARPFRPSGPIRRRYACPLASLYFVACARARPSRPSARPIALLPFAAQRNPEATSHAGAAPAGAAPPPPRASRSTRRHSAHQIRIVGSNIQIFFRRGIFHTPLFRSRTFALRPSPICTLELPQCRSKKCKFPVF
jgi:hypothetical protein